MDKYTKNCGKLSTFCPHSPLFGLLVSGFPQPQDLSTGLSTDPFTTYKLVVFSFIATNGGLSHIPQVLIVVITNDLNSWGL